MAAPQPSEVLTSLPRPSDYTTVAPSLKLNKPFVCLLIYAQKLNHLQSSQIGPVHICYGKLK